MVTPISSAGAGGHLAFPSPNDVSPPPPPRRNPGEQSPRRRLGAATEKCIIFLVATYGEGEPTDAARTRGCAGAAYGPTQQ